MRDALLDSAANVTTAEHFRRWTRQAIRPVFPHEALACGLGHLHAGGVSLDYVIVVDYPIAHLEAIRNKAGAIDTPILRRWLATRTPQLFEPDRSDWPEINEEWLRHFRANDLRNAATHACYDAERCVGTYFSFHRIPGQLDKSMCQVLERVVPVMHEILYRVVDNVSLPDGPVSHLSRLTEREREVVQWLRQGKNNGAIAAIVGLSETTVKHHLTHAFRKLGVESRAQCIRLLLDSGERGAVGRGTHLL
jgi:transcriptional regulator EpsA